MVPPLLIIHTFFIYIVVYHKLRYAKSMKRFCIFFTLFCLSFPVQIWAGEDSSNAVLVRWKGQSDSIQSIRSEDLEHTLAQFQTDPRVDHVEANVVRTITTLPNDPELPLQYYLHQVTDYDIDAGRAWNSTTGDKKIIVAVIDTGVDLDHPDLAANIWINQKEIPNNHKDDDNNGYVDDVQGWDFVEDDNDPNPTPTSNQFSSIVVKHGTHVAGIIGAVGNNAQGVSGVNWQVSLMPLRVFNDTGSSNTADIVSAIRYAIKNGAKVINMSYGGEDMSKFELEAIQKAQSKGIIVIAAAGNEHKNLNTKPIYPVCYSGVLGVAATDIADQLASFSNYGKDCVQLTAPGENIMSTVYYNPTQGFNNHYEYLSGTSMATPIVSGVSALLYSYDPESSLNTVTESLTATTDKSHSTTLGRINAAKALRHLRNISGPALPQIVAYHSERTILTINRNTRSADTNPYFKWEEPKAAHPIVGYYVYWGKIKRQPRIKGHFQKQAWFSPKGVRSNNKAYRLRVQAVDDQGNVSAIASFRYISDTRIKPPQNVIARTTSQGVVVKWQPPAHEYSSGYQVYRAVDDSTNFTQLTLSQVTASQFLDITAQSGHTYNYKVQAFDDIGNVSHFSAVNSIRL